MSVTKPVSYTHLDVYKRQPLDHWTCDNLLWWWVENVPNIYFTVHQSACYNVIPERESHWILERAKHDQTSSHLQSGSEPTKRLRCEGTFHKKPAPSHSLSLYQLQLELKNSKKPDNLKWNRDIICGIESYRLTQDITTIRVPYSLYISLYIVIIAHCKV